MADGRMGCLGWRERLGSGWVGRVQ